MDRGGGERRWKEGLDWNPVMRKSFSLLVAVSLVPRPHPLDLTRKGVW